MTLIDSELLKRQVEALDPARFVQLCTDLLSETCAAHAIPRSCLSVNLRITEPDGGIDARCVNSPITVGRLIPRSSTAFQFKSGKGKSAIAIAREDILRKPRVRERLLDGDAFVFVTGWDAGDELEARVEQAVQAGDGPDAGIPVEAGQIAVISSYTVAKMLPAFPALLYRIVGAGDATLYEFGQWETMRGFQNPFETDAELDARIHEIRVRLQPPSSIVRVIGAAGNGKSRAVLEAIRGSEFADSVLYAEQPDQLTTNFCQYLARTPDVRCLLVIDEVDDRAADDLENRFSLMPPGVRVLTIGVDASGQARGTTVALNGVEEDTLVRAIQAVAVGLDEQVARTIARISERSPKLAILLAGRVRDTPRLASVHRLLTDGDVRKALDRYLNIDRNAPEWRALSALAVLPHVGWDGDAASESEHLFRALELDPVLARQLVDSLHDQYGIAPHAGRFRYVSPQLLGDHLAVSQIANWTADRMRAVLEILGPHMARRFARLLRRIAEALRDRSVIETAIFGDEGPFQSLDHLEGSPLAALLRELSGAFPWATLEVLERIIPPATDEALIAATASRRDLVDALSELLWRKDMFERVARLLLRLAVNENELSIGNSAERMFVETFQTNLGRTAAGPDRRLRVLRSAASDESPRVRHIAAKSLGAVMKTDYATRAGNPPSDVEGMPEEAWRPKTYGEWWEAIRGALALLAPLLVDSDPGVRTEAAQALAEAVPAATSFPISKEWLEAAQPLLSAPFEERRTVERAILRQLRRLRAAGQIGDAVDAIVGQEMEPPDEEEDDDPSLDDRQAEDGGDDESTSGTGQNVEADDASGQKSRAEFEERVQSLARFAVRLRGEDFSSRLRRAASRDTYAVSVNGHQAEMARVRGALSDLAHEGLRDPDLIDAEWEWFASQSRAHAWEWADLLGGEDVQRKAAEGLLTATKRDVRLALQLSAYELAYARQGDDETWVDRRVGELRGLGLPALAFDLLNRAGYRAERIVTMTQLFAEGDLGRYALASLGYPPWSQALPPAEALQLVRAAEEAGFPPETIVGFLDSYLEAHPDSLGLFADEAIRALESEPSPEATRSHDDYEWFHLARRYAAARPLQVFRAALAYVAARKHSGDNYVDDVLIAAWNAGEKEQLLTQGITPWIDGDYLAGWHVRSALEHFPLGELHVERLRRWVVESPSTRAPALAEILGFPNPPMSDAHAMLLIEFGEHRVENVYFGALISGAFWGSAAERTRGLIGRVSPFLADARLPVREWAASFISSLEGMVKQDTERESEDRLRG